MSRHAPRRTSGTVYSCRAVAVALLTLAGQLSSIGHLALSRHAICAEHGELIDVDEEVASATPASAEDDLFSIDATAGSRSAHGHDHCSLAAHRRATTPACRAKIYVVSGDFTLGLRCLEVDSPRPAPVATLRVAPKNSPPA